MNYNTAFTIHFDVFRPNVLDSACLLYKSNINLCKLLSIDKYTKTVVI